MKKIILFFLLVIIAINPLAQSWTEPVNISNMPGLDNMADLCIDKNGVLHCVFSHKINNSWRKIYYSYSDDNGLSWSDPIDVSRNTERSCLRANIVSDTNGIIHLTYDYNYENPAQTQVFYRTYDGIAWSDSLLISGGYPGAHGNKLIIDNLDRLYCFWYWAGNSYYRYSENGQWSDVIFPYEGEYYWIITNIVADGKNDLQCLGMHLEEGQYISDARLICFKYLHDNNLWTDLTYISGATWLDDSGSDIKINSNNDPHIAYRQYTYGSSHNHDSTMYVFYNDNEGWSEPELVVNDPYEQRIAVDQDNDAHIIDREKTVTGTKLVHYQKLDNIWQGYIIDSAANAVGMPKLLERNNKLFLVYIYSDEENDGEVYFTTDDIITGTNHIQSLVKSFTIYPNPFNKSTSIEFTIETDEELNIAIIDLNGKTIRTYQKKTFSAGKHILKWDGTDNNGKEVKNGLYIVRLLAGRYIVTKPVEVIR